jgi:hypothetical protein
MFLVGDPLLDDIAQAAGYVELANKMLKLSVLKAKIKGRSWGEIAVPLGVSPQATRQRWSRFLPKDLARIRRAVTPSADGTLGASDHAGGLDGDSPAGPGDDGDPLP